MTELALIIGEIFPVNNSTVVELLEESDVRLINVASFKQARDVVSTSVCHYVLCNIDEHPVESLKFVYDLLNQSSDISLILLTERPKKDLKAIELMAETAGANVVEFHSPNSNVDKVHKSLRQFAENRNDRKSLAHWMYQESDLLAALYSGDIQNVYQKKVCSKTGDIVGYEVLSQLHTVDGEYVAAGAFLSKNLSKSFYGQLFLKSFESALYEWNSLSVELPFSINVPPYVLDVVGIFDCIDRLLTEYEFDSSKCIFELTEDYFCISSPNFLYTYNQLKQIGITFSIDDFGELESSLERLTVLSFSELKISRKMFLRSMEDPHIKCIVTGLINSCKQHGIKSVLEGIETDKEFTLALNLGPDFFQGYRWGKPSILSKPI